MAKIPKDWVLVLKFDDEGAVVLVSQPKPAKWKIVLKSCGVIVDDNGIQLKYWDNAVNAWVHNCLDTSSKGGNASTCTWRPGDLNMLLKILSGKKEKKKIIEVDNSNTCNTQ